MKKSLCISLILFLLSSVMLVVAQDKHKTIIDDINTRKVGQGNIRIMQDETIDQELGQYNINVDTAGVIRLSNEKMKGFKIQVYSGQSRGEAESKQAAVRAEFKKHQAEVTYNSPTWRLRVGNFQTRAEAEEVLAEMKAAFPSFGKEMYIVNDIIRRPL